MNGIKYERSAFGFVCVTLLTLHWWLLWEKYNTQNPFSNDVFVAGIRIIQYTMRILNYQYENDNDGKYPSDTNVAASQFGDMRRS